MLSLAWSPRGGRGYFSCRRLERIENTALCAKNDSAKTRPCGRKMIVVLLAAASCIPAVVTAASPLAAPARAHRALAPTLDCNRVLAAVHKALNGNYWTKEVNGRFVGYDVGWQWPDPSIDCCSKEFVRSSYPRPAAAKRACRIPVQSFAHSPTTTAVATKQHTRCRSWTCGTSAGSRVLSQSSSASSPRSSTSN